MDMATELIDLYEEKIVDIEIPFAPVAWHLNFKQGQIRPFLGRKAVLYKEMIRHYVRAAMTNSKNKVVVGPLDETAIMLTIFFNYNKKFRYQNTMGQWRKRVPDCTNVQKLVEDALTGLIYKDDVQTRIICTARHPATKNYLHLVVFKYTKREEENDKYN